MIIKVCGIKTKENIAFLSKADIDMVGLNFYKPSVRYISADIQTSNFDKFDSSVKKVGVFVNESIKVIQEKIREFELDYVQLHGDEDLEFCDRMAEFIPVIKVFRVDENFDFKSIDKFTSAAYFLFDTQTKHYGGSGKKFDWNKLNRYEGSIPFVLSGGIAPDDQKLILDISHPQFAGIDINSKFESAPGIKDQSLILPFIQSIRYTNTNK